MNPVYATATATSMTAFALARWDVQVRGAEHLPASGPAVIATNHVGHLDFVFVGYAARRQRRRVRFVAKREVFDHRVIGPLMRAMGHIRVDRGGDTQAALREAAAALRGGDVVGMFPEGTISRSFVPLAGRSGAAQMALEAGAPLVPGAVWGSQRLHVRSGSLRYAPRTAISVTFGPPLQAAPGERAAGLHARLMERIRALVDQAQRAYPQRPAGGEDAWWLPAHLGGSAPSVEEAEAEARRAADQRRQIAIERRRVKHARAAAEAERSPGEPEEAGHLSTVARQDGQGGG
ncbi:MAG: lysophospholipid acyltransferase family protein [Actinomycetota bacterium]